MSESFPLISIVIPVKNGAAWLHKTIPAMLAQTLSYKTEIIVIDSGSTDNTLSLLSQFPVRVIQIEPSAFNHGTVRNLGAGEAKGRYTVMTVQDAEPVDNNWLQSLLDGFDDENVAGVCGQQVVPHEPDKNPVDWFRPISEPQKTKFLFEDTTAFDRLSDQEKKDICRWDDVNAMYRTEILLKIPFREVAFAEDALWAKDALRSGYAIVYNPFAKVNHYHFETPEYTFRRNFTTSYHYYKFFGVKPVRTKNGVITILRNIKLLMKENKIAWKDKWKWLWFNYRQRKAVNQSVNIFNSTIANGEAALEKKHQEINKVSPQAVNPFINRS